MVMVPVKNPVIISPEESFVIGCALENINSIMHHHIQTMLGERRLKHDKIIAFTTFYGCGCNYTFRDLGLVHTDVQVVDHGLCEKHSDKVYTNLDVKKCCKKECDYESV